jgi:hypothetical protein
VNAPTASDLNAARGPIASLLSKSAKAQQKLALGSWQHRLLRDNLRALHIASALMSKSDGDAVGFERDELKKALAALGSMNGRVEKAKAGFAPGTSQHTLQRNRLHAMRVARALTLAALDECNA